MYGVILRSLKVKTLLFSVDYKPMPGGIAEHTHQLARHLQQDGDDVVILTTKMGGDRQFDDEQPFPIYRTTSVPILKVIILFLYFPWIIYKYKIEWVYCPMWYPTGVIAILFSLITNIDIAIGVHAHEVVYSEENLTKRLAERLKYFQAWFLKQSAVVIAVSEYTKNRIVDIGVSESNIEIVNNGVVPEKFETDQTHEIREKNQDDHLILTVARLEPRKGHDMVIRALPKIQEKIPNVTYLIAGNGEYKNHLRQLTADIGVSESVEFLGYVPDDELPSLYNSADVFIMPNRREGTSVEGFGIVFLEANAAGIPVVGGNHGGVTDAVINEETGYLVDPQDTDAIASAVVDLLMNKSKRKKMGKRGRKRVIQDFDWNRVTDRFKEVLQKHSTKKHGE
jgi:phosphatidylinositol alpha-1,6-mannosyltransferase